MAKPSVPLPPFAALRAFHAAATHDRHRDAAESLGITESAISHQIRKLESLLHTKLFDRTGNRAALTETGRRYLAQIDPAIRQIQAATEAILPAQGRSAVRLTLPPDDGPEATLLPALRRYCSTFRLVHVREVSPGGGKEHAYEVKLAYSEDGALLAAAVGDIPGVEGLSVLLSDAEDSP